MLIKHSILNLIGTVNFTVPISGAPVGARTQNAAVGGRDFIQLDYKRIDEIIAFFVAFSNMI